MIRRNARKGERSGTATCLARAKRVERFAVRRKTTKAQGRVGAAFCPNLTSKSRSTPEARPTMAAKVKKVKALKKP